MKKIIIFSLVLGSAFLSFCSSKPNPNLKLVKFTGEAQGSYYAITYYEKNGVNWQPQIDSILKQIDHTASSWDPNSIISRVNRNDPHVKLNSHFVELFKQSVDASEKSGGAFDMTVGPLVNAWGFGFRKRDSITPHLIDSLLPLVNYKNISIQNHKIHKKYPQMRIDFDGIAQGYTADVIAQFLQSKGVVDYLVDVGGEGAAHGHKPNGDPWRVGIERPTREADDEREVQIIVRLKDCGYSTSGSYRKYWEKDSIRYSHTIDPQTGYPVSHSLLSVTVIAKDGITADAYCTVFMVMGVEKSRAFLMNHPEMQACFISAKKGGGFEIFATEGFDKLIEK